jgi:PAS domain S-box-containing protein
MPLSSQEFWWAITLGTLALLAFMTGYLALLVRSRRQIIAIRERQIEEVSRHEEKFRNLFENSLVGMFRLSFDDWSILEGNSSLFRILAATSVEDANMAFSTMPLTDRDRFKTTLLGGETVRGFETRFITAQGTIDVAISGKLFVESGFVEGVIEDVTQRKRAEKQLKSSNRQLSVLAAKLQAAREEERKNVALLVHDELGQPLTAVKIYLNVALDSLRVRGNESAEAVEKLKSSLVLVDKCLGIVKNLASQLRLSVLEHFGLKEAMEIEISHFQAFSGIECAFTADLVDVQFELDQSTAIFRIFQEALTNIARHAEASSADITLKRNGRAILLTISDNGRGIDTDETETSDSLGIMAMRERASFLGGTLAISGTRGKGTTVRLEVPLNDKDGEHGEKQ